MLDDAGCSAVKFLVVCHLVLALSYRNRRHVHDTLRGADARAACSDVLYPHRLSGGGFYSNRAGSAGIGWQGIKCRLQQSFKERKSLDVLAAEDKTRFEQLVLPHVDAAVNLARWLLRNPHDAEDVAQEAVLRAYRFFGGFRGGDARAWLLQIVRNSCYTWLQNRKPAELVTEFNEEVHSAPSLDPEAAAVQASDRSKLKAALESLPVRAREVIVLRELEGCSYKEISEVTGIPMGTVMSTLSRAREKLSQVLGGNAAKEASNEL